MFTKIKRRIKQKLAAWYAKRKMKQVANEMEKNGHSEMAESWQKQMESLTEDDLEK